MIDAMSYKGYRAAIDVDDGDGLLVGHVADIPDIVGFHADTLADLRLAFEEAVDDYIEICQRSRQAPSGGKTDAGSATDRHRSADAPAE